MFFFSSLNIYSRITVSLGYFLINLLTVKILPFIKINVPKIEKILGDNFF